MSKLRAKFKTRATFLTNQMPTETNRDLVARVFPRLASVSCKLLRVLIGSLCYFRVVIGQSDYFQFTTVENLSIQCS